MAAKSSREITVEIIAGLDVAAEFAALGVEIVGEPRASGMVSCRAIGRDDKKPSAWINTHSGFYGDSGGKDIAASTCSLFDLAVRVGKFADWKDARRFYADKAGVKLTRGPAAAKDDWHNRLIFQSWATTGNDILATRWCLLHKKGVTLEAIKAAGGQMAYYPCHWDTDKKEVVKNHNCRQVIAIPAYGEWLLDAPPAAWILYDLTGAEFDHTPPGTPANEKRQTSKSTSCGPTRGTIVGLSGLMVLVDSERRSSVEVVWRVEGPPDLMALWAAIEAGAGAAESEREHAKYPIITFGGGATADVLPHQVKLLAGLRVAIVPDADKAGEAGGEKWATAINPTCESVRIVRLPFEVRENKGLDVRDFINGVPLSTTG